MLFLVLASLFTVSILTAQKNVIKIKPIAPAVGALLNSPINLPLTYERVLIPRLTGSINFSYTLKSDLDVPNLTFGDFGVPTINSGVVFGPEIRFYPIITKDTPRGLYLSAFYKRRSMSIEGGFKYKDKFVVPDGQSSLTVPYAVDLDYEGKWKSNGFGIAIGPQWIVAKFITIDIQRFGIGWGGYTINADVDGKLVDLDLIKENIATEAAAYLPVGTAVPTSSFTPTWSGVSEKLKNQNIDLPESLQFLVPNIEAEKTGEGSNVVVSSSMPSISAFSFSIGIAF
jgi:hypothetical protein